MSTRNARTPVPKPGPAGKPAPLAKPEAPQLPLGLRLKAFALSELAEAQALLAKPGDGRHEGVHQTRKRLRRARADRWLGGVCGGLGRVSGVDSWVWRLVFALCVMFAGFGALIYLLMWIFVPEE